MKKIILILCIFTFSVSVQATDTEKFVSQYSGQYGYTVVTLGKPAIRMMLIVSRISGSSSEDVKLMSNTESVRIISLDVNSPKDRIDAFVSNVLQFSGSTGFEKFVTVEELASSVIVFSRLDNDTITGLIILDVDETLKTVDAVFVDGKFSFEDVSGLASSNFKMFNKK